MNAARVRLAAPADVEPEAYAAHRAHTDDARIWRETNCYMDLWIEVLHLLGHDPVPSFACALSADHDGSQWTFLKPEPSDLRVLYGLEVTEDALWQPVLETVESGPDRGLLHTVEVDSWWLPDTVGTDYRTAHVKTTIVPLHVDRAAHTMTYLHNAGMYRLADKDFVGVFGLDAPAYGVLPPYIEQIRWFPGRAEPDRIVDLVRSHLDRRPDGNPVELLAETVRAATRWLPDVGVETYHRWAFATLRQCGASAELAADLVTWLELHGVAGAGAAHAPLIEVAAGVKAVQFKLARAARGRAVDVDAALTDVGTAWTAALDVVATAVR